MLDCVRGLCVALAACVSEASCNKFSTAGCVCQKKDTPHAEAKKASLNNSAQRQGQHSKLIHTSLNNTRQQQAQA
jgi:hypothetical protein